MTLAALDTTAESVEDFQLRRLNQTMRDILSEGEVVDLQRNLTHFAA